MPCARTCDALAQWPFPQHQFFLAEDRAVAARLRGGRASAAARGAGLGRRCTGGTRGDGARGDVEPLGTCVKIDQRVRLSWELFASRYLGTAAMLPAELAPL